ncbi:hypothetical protein OOJ09_30900 [Mesorhizobium qingshengii]|uniref:Cytochrome c domain-containing protein n=1 Tax=Mesorhizobium qingshengii TaxID=1165689 RepID=A0ABT4R448_9HYPH|nr:hypothetical protein [Mesorhizobium qingshengii]MCZ8548592.1 hypothetical protein [Mesorhizobium qingshengii]
MRALRNFLRLTIVFAGCAGVTAAFAGPCDVPSGSTLDDAAKIQFNCSSSRPLKDLPAGDQEFKVHYDFPVTVPTIDAPWRSIDPSSHPEQYLRALLEYGIRDNVAVDWRLEQSPGAHWCHAPWFHDGRERIHGMTRERGSRVRELGELQLSRAENWAVGFYNPVGCFALGQVWKDPARPKTKDFVFPADSFSIKLLFTTAPLIEVPYLTGSKSWNAAIGNDGSVRPMRLLQVDVAVKDPRAGPTGWVFGTFIYDAYAPGEDVWAKLVPVGLMWGNDPDLTLKRYEEEGGTPRQSWVNPDVAAKFVALPRHHLGLFGRLNGPVDNFKSACLACHGRALDWGRGIPADPADKITLEANRLLPIAINPTDEAALRMYFRNLQPTDPFVAGTQSLDFSLQLAGGIFNFRRWIDQNFPASGPETRDVMPYVFDSEKPGQPAVERSLSTAVPLERDISGQQVYSPFTRGD